MAGIAGTIILLLSAVAFLLARDCRNKKKEMEVLLQRLDDALNGEVEASAYDESLDSAITERLDKLLRSSSMGKERAYQDRDRIKALISDISHQIRTPLSNIMLYTGLLQEKNLDGQSRILADQIQGQAEKLDFFMKELIRSSYMETDMIVVSPRTAPVGELVDRACQAVEAEALKKGILIRQPETDRIICKFDMKWTLEAVRNILENALKYSPEGSEVQIEIAPNEAFTCISIQDEGIGIREEEQGLVFERFYRSRDVKKEPGMGIGLYLAREIISRQGGYIEARSEYAKGTCFCIYLPNF